MLHCMLSVSESDSYPTYHPPSSINQVHPGQFYISADSINKILSIGRCRILLNTLGDLPLQGSDWIWRNNMVDNSNRNTYER